MQIVYDDPELEDKKLELFSMPEDFMYNHLKFGYDIFGRPEIGESMGLIDYYFPKLTVEQLREKYGVSKNPVQEKVEIQSQQNAPTGRFPFP